MTLVLREAVRPVTGGPRRARRTRNGAAELRAV
jgi:hypothetical protein